MSTKEKTAFFDDEDDEAEILIVKGGENVLLMDDSVEKPPTVNPEEEHADVKEVPGPLTSWESEFNVDGIPMHTKIPPNCTKAQDLPNPYVPSTRKEIVENSKEKWTPPHKGYPHVEDVMFQAAQNDGMHGNCYFGAFAILLYRSNKYWAAVKAQHLAFFESVLRNKDHPRFQLYTDLNKVFSKRTNALPPSNLWQRLNRPYSWQDGEIMQVTADLYDLFIVQYETDTGLPSKVTSVKIRGNYNSRHVVIRFIRNNHYQPLLPSPRAEFTFPEVTRDNTQGKVGVSTKPASGATDLNHPWRVQISRTPVPEQLLPTPVIPTPTPLHWSLVLGFNTKQSTMDMETLKTLMRTRQAWRATILDAESSTGNKKRPSTGNDGDERQRRRNRKLGESSVGQ